jgi:hypothetical protein
MHYIFMKNKTLLIIGIIITLVFLGVLANVQVDFVGAQADLVCDGLTDATGNACGSTAADPQPSNLIKTGINLLSIVAGVIAVVMIMIAGLKFITSQGDPGKISSARTAALYAIIGVVIVALSQTIVFFVIRDNTSTANSDNTSTTRNGDTQQRTGPR